MVRRCEFDSGQNTENSLHQKTSEKPLALDMGRKATATSVALKYF